jgi:hypothetical protein
MPPAMSPSQPTIGLPSLRLAVPVWPQALSGLVLGSSAIQNMRCSRQELKRKFASGIGFMQFATRMEFILRANEVMSADVVPCTPSFETSPGAVGLAPPTLAGHELVALAGAFAGAGSRVVTFLVSVVASVAEVPGVARFFVLWTVLAEDCTVWPTTGAEASAVTFGASLVDPLSLEVGVDPDAFEPEAVEPDAASVATSAAETAVLDAPAETDADAPTTSTPAPPDALVALVAEPSQPTGRVMRTATATAKLVAKKA